MPSSDFPRAPEGYQIPEGQRSYRELPALSAEEPAKYSDDGVTWHEGTATRTISIYECSHCGSVVPQRMFDTHDRWHARIERLEP